MNKLRTSLMYPLGYLTVAGAGLAFVPRFALRLMFSNEAMGDVAFARMAGVLLLGLAGIVFQIIRRRVEALYTTLIWVRVFFCAGWLALYATSGDPFFLAVFGVVAFGLAMSTAAKVLDRSRRK